MSVIHLGELYLDEIPPDDRGPCLMRRRSYQGQNFPWNPGWGFDTSDAYRRSYCVFKQNDDFEIRWIRDRFEDYRWTERIQLPNKLSESFDPIEPEDDGFYAVERSNQQFLGYLHGETLHVVIVDGPTQKCQTMPPEEYNFLVRYEPPEDENRSDDE